ncbi:hypothetical protein LTR54_018482, partial [Friedmanniomyces endolithicus]
LQYLPVHLEPRRIPLHEGHDSTSSDTEHPTLPDDDAGTTSSAHEHSLEAGLERLMGLLCERDDRLAEPLPQVPDAVRYAGGDWEDV